MKSKLSISFVLMMSLFYSCTDELSISTDVITMPPINTTQPLEITASSTWVATSSETWLTLSDASGKGNKSVVLTSKDNYSGTARTAKIMIQEGKQSKTVLVSQGGGDVILNEDFKDNSMNWVTTTDSISTTINNSYLDIKSAAKYYNNYVGTKSLILNYTANYMISSDFKIIMGDNPFGLTFGNKDPNNFYRVLVYPTGGILISQKLNGVYTTIYSAVITNYKFENTLSLVKVGNFCFIYFNGIYTGKFDFSSPYGSYVGFYILPQSEVMVHYLKINQF
ncbi:MAG: BACON domain-containing protein [Paludibacter sp.]